MSSNSLDCFAVAPQSPTTSMSSQYVIKSGDTLSAIATRFGFASWRDVYNHPDNQPFRAKRPNPDKIFPGDVLIIPGRPVDPSLLPPSGRAPFLSFSMPLLAPPVLGFAGKKPKDDPLALDYKHPGNVKIRLTLFWMKNAVNIDTTSEVVIAKAEEIFRAHGLELDVFPARKRTDAHTIATPPNVVSAGGLLINNPPEQNHYNELRLEGARIFDDQKSPGQKQRLPVFFCEFKDTANGVTVIGSPWLPYVLVSGVLAPDRATLAHEIVHAAGIAGHLRGLDNQKNLMSELNSSRAEMFKLQVQKVAGAYFCT